MREDVRHVAVMGLMGVGKSTVGAALAERLGWAFRDSDSDIEAATGRTVRELGDQVGEAAMHDLEARQLLDALDDPAPSVVAAAASTIDDARCRRRLAESDVAVVWLRGLPATLAARFASSAHRPAYGPDPATFLAEQAARRYPLYRALRPVVVDVDASDAAGVVVATVEALVASGVRTAAILMEPDGVRSATSPVAPDPGKPGDPRSERPRLPGRMDLPTRGRDE